MYDTYQGNQTSIDLYACENQFDYKKATAMIAAQCENYTKMYQSAHKSFQEIQETTKEHYIMYVRETVRELYEFISTHGDSNKKGELENLQKVIEYNDKLLRGELVPFNADGADKIQNFSEGLKIFHERCKAVISEKSHRQAQLDEIFSKMQNDMMFLNIKIGERQLHYEVMRNIVNLKKLSDQFIKTINSQCQ